MRIVLYTHEDFWSDELFRYIFAHVAANYPNTRIAAVRRVPLDWRSRLVRTVRKFRRLGPAGALEFASSLPIARRIHRRHSEEIDAGLRSLARPVVEDPSINIAWTRTVNGPDAVAAISELEPDLLIQAGAGIIRPGVFNLAPLGMLNIHHGIAPLIRGMHSIAWALLEDRPECLGATVHRVDAGIDTGDVLAYAPVSISSGDGVASVFVRATEAAVRELLLVMRRLETGERWMVEPLLGARTYRSSISGWRLWALERRLRDEDNLRAE